MRIRSFLIIPFVILLVGCAGRVSDLPTAEPTATVAQPIVPTAPLSCTGLLERDGFHLAPEDASSLQALAAVAAVGGSTCTWIATAWDSLTVIVLPSVDEEVPAASCAVTDEGFGDHYSCQFDALENGYRLSAFLMGGQGKAEAEVLNDSQPIIAAFRSIASRAESGVAPVAPTAAPDCVAFDGDGLSFESERVYVASRLPGTSLEDGTLLKLAGVASCRSKGSGDTSIVVVPSADPATLSGMVLRGDPVSVAGAVEALATGDGFGSTIYVLDGTTLVIVSKSELEREAVAAYTGSVLAVLEALP